MSQSPPTVESHLSEAEGLMERYRSTGQVLYDACAGELFPCDGLAMAVLDRSLNVLNSFVLLLRNHGYICGAALLRMQLDNVLRLNGVITSQDPHGIAAQIWSGTSLRTLKDRSGQKMTDARLVKLLAPRSPSVAQIYDQASRYVHLLRGAHSPLLDQVGPQ
jgi:hypothetical protein